MEHPLGKQTLNSVLLSLLSYSSQPPRKIRPFIPILQMRELRLKGDTQVRTDRKWQSQNMNSVLSLARAHVSQVHHVMQSSL